MGSKTVHKIQLYMGPPLYISIQQITTLQITTLQIQLVTVGPRKHIVFRKVVSLFISRLNSTNLIFKLRKSAKIYRFLIGKVKEKREVSKTQKRKCLQFAFLEENC